MDQISERLNGNKQELLVAALTIEGVLTFAFVICSFVVAGTANNGFNCVLTGFLNIAFICGSYFVLKTSRSPIAVSFLIRTVQCSLTNIVY